VIAGATHDAASADSTQHAFIGHLQNFLLDGVDVIGLLQSHVNSTQLGLAPPTDHSVLAHSGTLTDHERPIPVHPVTLRAPRDTAAGVGAFGFLTLPTIDLSHGNATLKLMFKTRVRIIILILINLFV